MLEGFMSESIVGRAQRLGLVEIGIHNIRDWSRDPHHSVDDRPFGGGAGMVLKAEPLSEAVSSLKQADSNVIYLCPDGQLLSTPIVRRLASAPHLILVSGHYEGVDERFREHYIDEEISIGDYVLTNGTLPAAVLLDAVVRYVPGALGDEQSLQQDSFSQTLLTFPQYTRPQEFEGQSIPDVLMSGDHAAIASWRFKQQLIRTLRRRPDLIFNR